MSDPVICARTGCHHRLRMHAQGVDGANQCLTSGCRCYDFLEQVDVLMAELRMTEEREHPVAMAEFPDLSPGSEALRQYQRMFAADPIVQSFMAELGGEPYVAPHCRHRGGEVDCDTTCLIAFGDRFYTVVLPNEARFEMFTIPEYDRTPSPTEEDLMNPWQNRHPSVKHFGPLFGYAHLPPHLQAVSRPFGEIAGFLLSQLKDGPELSTALRKLVEAKDCAVRQLVQDRAEADES